ncbi:MAG: Rv0361 family membrane protein [Thermoleophilia bacterium]
MVISNRAGKYKKKGADVRKQGTILKVISAGMVLAVLMLAAVGCGSSPSTAAVENFMKAAQDKDCGKMIDLMDLSAAQAQGAINKDELIKSCEDSKGLGDVVSYKILEEKVDGDSATIKVEVTTKEGDKEKTESDTLTVKKVDGDWKISIL